MTAPVDISSVLARINAKARTASKSDLIELPGLNAMSFEDASRKVFAKRNLEYVGGPSSERGWSAFNTLEQCAYRFKLKYRTPLPVVPGMSAIVPVALQVGSYFHMLLALHYLHMRDGKWLMEPEEFRDELAHENVSGEVLLEGDRLYSYYVARYENERVEVLEVEKVFVMKNPAYSCRYDLILKVISCDGITPGIYVCDHKSAAHLGDSVLGGWRSDGEILGQLLVWRELGLEKTYGPLAGAMVNLISKTKLPEMARICVMPKDEVLNDFKMEIKQHSAMLQVFDRHGHFPRSRAACTGRYGFCPFIDHCAG